MKEEKYEMTTNSAAMRSMLPLITCTSSGGPSISTTLLSSENWTLTFGMFSVSFFKFAPLRPMMYLCSQAGTGTTSVTQLLAYETMSRVTTSAIYTSKKKRIIASSKACGLKRTCQFIPFHRQGWVLERGCCEHHARWLSHWENLTSGPLQQCLFSRGSPSS